MYAVWFPVPRILKVGFTTHFNNGIFTAVARRKAKDRGWDTDGRSCIWKQPGDLRTEAWMQVSLAYRWLPAFEQYNRICEWFAVPCLLEGEIVVMLDEIYGLVPDDLTENTQGSRSAA